MHLVKESLSISSIYLSKSVILGEGCKGKLIYFKLLNKINKTLKNLDQFWNQPKLECFERFYFSGKCYLAQSFFDWCVFSQIKVIRIGKIGQLNEITFFFHFNTTGITIDLDSFPFSLQLFKSRKTIWKPEQNLSEK